MKRKSNKNEYVKQSDLESQTQVILEAVDTIMGKHTKELREEIYAVRDELKTDISEVRDELYTVRDELKTDINNVQTFIKKFIKKKFGLEIAAV